MFKIALILACPALAAAAPCEDAGAEVWNVVAKDTGLTACFQDGASCWTFDGKAWTAAAPNATPKPGEGETNRGLHQVAETSADGKRAFVKDEDDGNKLSLVDTATRKPIAKIATWKTMENGGFPIFGFVEDSAVVWRIDSPVSSQAKLYDPKGKLLARIGTGDVAEGTALALGNHQWLFPSSRATRPGSTT